jgi:predicted alternative tryptophan synthase beta-subunit
MPIRPFLKGVVFNPEATHAMGLAFERACQARTDLDKETVAKRIIELARQGEHDPDRLCELILKEIGERPRL